MERVARILILSSIALPLIAARGGAQDAFTTEQFLKQCQSDSDWCKEHVISLVSAHNAGNAISPDDVQSCPPRNVAAKGEEITGKIVGWLKAHPETKGETDGDGIEAALKALYPCK